MKLVYLHQYFIFPHQPGGTRSYDLAMKFIAKGIEVEIVTSTSDVQYKLGKRWSTIRKDGLVVHYIYLPYSNNLSYFKRTIVFMKFLFFSIIKLLSLNADVVLATSTPLTVGIPALINKSFRKVPFVFEVRDVWPEAVIAIGAVKNKFVKRTLYSLERALYHAAAAIVPLSIDMKKSILLRYPALATKPIIVIENIAEVNRFQDGVEKVDLKELMGKEPRFTVLYAGTFGKVNDLGYVLSLASKTLEVDPSIVYLLIGNGSEKNDILADAEKLGLLHRNVFILEPINKAELPRWYAAVDMGSSFVTDIPELWANSANKFFDTLAAGKPILINHEGWQANKIREEGIGYILPSKIDRKGIIDFVKYTNDQSHIDKQAEKALVVARECFALEIASEKYLEVFKKVLGAK